LKSSERSWGWQREVWNILELRDVENNDNKASTPYPLLEIPGGPANQTAMGYGIARVISVFAKDPDAWRHQKIVVATDELQIRGPGPLLQRYRLTKDGRVFVWEV
jgi:hypothetical protein